MSSPTTAQFDPYYKWLGIPPADQPANHYRLLGVVLFETDGDVIAAAADRQMAHIKSFATGRYAAQSQQLLNQLARARVCLLNPDRKVKYDEQLRAEHRQQVAATSPAHVAPPLAPPAIPGAAPHEVLVEVPATVPMVRVGRKRRSRPRHKSPGGMLLWILLLGACLAGALLLLVQLTAG